MGYDVIGDVHGQYGKLRALLGQLGYRERRGAWRHPAGRSAVFVGDLIDRGPEQCAVVDLARRMEDAGTARVVLGNHELNAIGYATPDAAGTGWLRRHSEKNERQHAEFLAQIGWDSPRHREFLAWFRTLPAALDLVGIRVCHAWWADDHVAAAAQASTAGRLDESFLQASFDKREAAYMVLEGLTKGLEVALPTGAAFVDHSGERRTEVRVRWWDATVTTFRAAAIVPEAQRHAVPEAALPADLALGNRSPVPVFVGHYWLTGTPQPQNANTAVLDYGAGLDGPLVAYRWEGEPTLRAEGFVIAGGR